jgi:N-acyl-D-aspartate/D-glutamate deacylase
MSTSRRRPRDAPLRFYAMGERAAAHEQATEEEMATMARLTGEAIAAGALGFTTSRTLAHKSVSGELTPTYSSAHRELGKIAVALRCAGTGVLQLITDYDDVGDDFALMRELVKISKRPLSVSLWDDPWQYRGVLDELTAANQAGCRSGPRSPHAAWASCRDAVCRAPVHDEPRLANAGASPSRGTG